MRNHPFRIGDILQHRDTKNVYLVRDVIPNEWMNTDELVIEFMVKHNGSYTHLKWSVDTVYSLMGEGSWNHIPVKE